MCEFCGDVSQTPAHIQTASTVLPALAGAVYWSRGLIKKLFVRVKKTIGLLVEKKTS